MVASEQPPHASYEPGAWVAIAGGDLWLLADLPPNSPLVRECWTLIRSGADVDAVLGVIVREGLRAISSFALVGPGADGRRLLLRGAARAELDAGAGEPTRRSAESAPTWLEVAVDDAQAVHLFSTDPADDANELSAAVGPTGGIELPLPAGVALASSIRIWPGGAAVAPAPSPMPATPPTPMPATPSTPMPAAQPTPMPAAPPAPPVVEQSGPPPPTPVAAAPEPGPTTPEPAAQSNDVTAEEPQSAASFDHLFGRTQDPARLAELQAREAASAAAPAAPPAPSANGAAPAGPPAAPGDGPPSAAPNPAESPPGPVPVSVDTMMARPPQNDSGIIESMPWLPPTGVVRAAAGAPTGSSTPSPPLIPGPPATEASPTPPAQAPAQPAGPSAAGAPGGLAPESVPLAPPGPWPGFSPPAYPGSPQAAPAPGSGFVAPPPTAAPGYAPGAAPPPPQFATGTEGSGPSEQTVNRAALHAQNGAPDWYVGPTVLAVLCPNGHLSPAHAGTCYICAAPIQAQDAFNAPRPVLGILTLSTGDMVTLDRDVIFGRAPTAPRADAQNRPHVVQLASPANDISRTHLQVRLDGWHVLVTDLGSTNGTVATLPGQQPIRLRPDDSLAIVPGTVVSLADEVSFRYEAPRS